MLQVSDGKIEALEKLGCKNCEHPIIYNIVTGIWQHGNSIALGEATCYLFAECKCLSAEPKIEEY